MQMLTWKYKHILWQRVSELSAMSGPHAARETHFFTCDSSLVIVPFVVANRAPFAVVENLNVALLREKEKKRPFRKFRRQFIGIKKLASFSVRPPTNLNCPSNGLYMSNTSAVVVEVVVVVEAVVTRVVAGTRILLWLLLLLFLEVDCWTIVPIVDTTLLLLFCWRELYNDKVGWSDNIKRRILWRRRIRCLLLRRLSTSSLSFKRHNKFVDNHLNCTRKNSSSSCSSSHMYKFYLLWEAFCDE